MIFKLFPGIPSVPSKAAFYGTRGREREEKLVSKAGQPYFKRRILHLNHFENYST